MFFMREVPLCSRAIWSLIELPIKQLWVERLDSLRAEVVNFEGNYDSHPGNGAVGQPRAVRFGFTGSRIIVWTCAGRGVNENPDTPEPEKGGGSARRMSISNSSSETIRNGVWGHTLWTSIFFFSVLLTLDFSSSSSLLR